MSATENWIARLDLMPHPEGGFFRRIYTDARNFTGADGTRALASSIHYLLTRDEPLGRLHRNRSTILHFLQDGGPVEYVLLPETGVCRRVVLGRGAGQQLFLEVPGGCWKGSRLLNGADQALVSEVVLPGFDFADHAFMSAAELLRDYPALANELECFVRA